MNWIYTILDAIPALWRVVEIKTEVMFLRQLRSYCLQLFRGELGEFEWIQDMTDTIADQIGKAWREGAKAVEVKPSEFTDEDIEELNKIIAGEYNYVLALGSDILALRLLGGTLEEYRSKFASRIEIWAHRYTDVVNQAVMWFGKRKKVKLKWQMGETEEHCASCAALDGLVAYASDWERASVHPQNPPNVALECGGWRCDCTLVPTKERAANNAFDEIVDRVTAAKDGEKSLKYDPNQARVPAGNQEGGQWISQNSMAGQVVDTVRDVEGEITGQRVEHGFLYGNNGDFVMRRTGKVDHVKWKPEELEKARGGYLTHNHPKGTSFSDGDLMQASNYEFKEMRVVTRDATFVARPAKSGWPTPKNLQAHFTSALNNAKKTPGYFKLSNLEQNRIVNRELMRFSGITIEEILHD